jgi:hypothetical protein
MGDYEPMPSMGKTKDKRLPAVATKQDLAVISGFKR